ncbi:MAG: YbaK/EbsC family protein [Dehalococcoidales bacterium]|nr:YbaK/EbsC family protein [Dehalococcoidales bacterium]
MGAVDRVQGLLAEAGLGIDVVHLEKDTRTAELAARALGTEVGAIVKSLVFLADEAVVLALVAGDKRADLGKVAESLGAKKVEIARGSVVKERTGFAIGGVPPLVKDGEGKQVPTLMDRHLFRYDTVYAAAGSPFDIFPVSPSALAGLVEASVGDITEV